MLVFGKNSKLVLLGDVDLMSYKRKGNQTRNGRLNVKDDATIRNFGHINLKVNDASIIVGENGHFINQFRGQITALADHSRVLNASGDFINKGIMHVNKFRNVTNPGIQSPVGTFTNREILLVDKTLYNEGLFINKSGWVTDDYLPYLLLGLLLRVCYRLLLGYSLFPQNVCSNK